MRDARCHGESTFLCIQLFIVGYSTTMSRSSQIPARTVVQCRRDKRYSKDSHLSNKHRIGIGRSSMVLARVSLDTSRNEGHFSIVLSQRQQRSCENRSLSVLTRWTFNIRCKHMFLYIYFSRRSKDWLRLCRSPMTLARTCLDISGIKVSWVHVSCKQVWDMSKLWDIIIEILLMW